MRTPEDLDRDVAFALAEWAQRPPHADPLFEHWLQSLGACLQAAQTAGQHDFVRCLLILASMAGHKHLPIALSALQHAAELGSAFWLEVDTKDETKGSSS